MADVKMKCSVCGHIYDPKKGDVGVDKDTDFSEVPADWKCPVCGAAKSAFFKID
ncbi:rubredoxin [Methanolacinia petrolearia]|uniref:rubredoxin n=1 Tax=Methanolacinia petrolearia TaxID=54120 RepID=UPI003BAD95B9